MIDKQDSYEGALDTYSKAERNKASSVGKNTFAVTEANINNCQTPWDPLRTRPGTLATNGHPDSLLARNDIQENGYESLPDKQRSAVKNRHVRDCQYQHIHREGPKNFETPVTMDSLPKDNGARTESDMRYGETWKIKDPSPMRAKDYNKTGNSHSEVTKIVPLKPQRSKKSLNKENKGVVNPQTQSQSDRGAFGATGDVQMIKSKDGFCETGRRVDDYTVQQSATDVVKENTAATKYHSESVTLYQQQTQLHQQIKNELFEQQELRDCRDLTGQSQWTRGGMLHEDHFQNNSEFKENLLSGSKFPTAPPRTLPLKTQWSRDRQSNMDNSHIHYRTPTQETAKRKQAVKHLPPTFFVSHRKVKHCMSFRRCRANLVFLPSQNTHILQNSCGCV